MEHYFWPSPWLQSHVLFKVAFSFPYRHNQQFQGFVFCHLSLSPFMSFPSYLFAPYLQRLILSQIYNHFIPLHLICLFPLCFSLTDTHVLAVSLVPLSFIYTNARCAYTTHAVWGTLLAIALSLSPLPPLESLESGIKRLLYILRVKYQAHLWVSHTAKPHNLWPTWLLGLFTHIFTYIWAVTFH